jgi:hypothetical protein
MAVRVQPRITSQTLTLNLQPFDSALDTPLFAHLNLLAPVEGAVMLFVGGEPLPFSMSRDTSVAMQVRFHHPFLVFFAFFGLTSVSIASGRTASRHNTQQRNV